MLLQAFGDGSFLVGVSISSNDWIQKQCLRHTPSSHKAQNACGCFQQQLGYLVCHDIKPDTQNQQSLHSVRSICHLTCWCRCKIDHLTLEIGQLNKCCTGVACTVDMRPVLLTSIDHAAAADGVRQDAWLAAAVLAEERCSLTHVPLSADRGVPNTAGTDVSVSDPSTPDTLASAWLAACTSNADRARSPCKLS